MLLLLSLLLIFIVVVFIIALFVLSTGIMTNTIRNPQEGTWLALVANCNACFVRLVYWVSNTNPIPVSRLKY